MLVAALEWHILWKRIFHPDHVFVLALWRTIYISVLAQALGVVLGLIAALMRMSKILPLRLLSGLYVLIFRGTPLIVQIFFVYFGANLLFGLTLIPRTVNFGAFQMDGAAFAGIIALGINEGAYMREIIRAGIDAVDKGQMEAARSVGMPYRLAMRRIVLPQATRFIVPPLGNEFNAMLKNSSLVFFIGVTELFGDAEIRYSTTFKPVEYFTAVAFWYLVLTTVWSTIQAQIERKLAVADRGEVVCVIGPSGSGKTTLIRCINHLEKIDGGRIEVNGHLIGYRERNGKLIEDSERNIARQRAEIGMVFQRFNLFPHMTALENVIEAPVRVRGMPKEQAAGQGEALLARVGLGDKRDVYPGKLSGG